MKTWFSRNIDRRGRLLRGLTAIVLLAAALLARPLSRWLALALLISGIFTLFEAARGWCVLRACGIRTRY